MFNRLCEIAQQTKRAALKYQARLTFEKENKRWEKPPTKIISEVFVKY